MVQVLQRMIEVMLACMEKPALAIGDSIPRIGTYPRVLLADLPIEIDVAVVALRRHVLPLPDHAVGAITRTWSASSSSASPASSGDGLKPSPIAVILTTLIRSIGRTDNICWPLS